MTYDLLITKKTVSGVVGVAAILFYLWLLTFAGPANAMPGQIAQPAELCSDLHQVKIFKRDRTPIYPYVTTGPGKRGWTGYFGFVPYTPGNVENEAIQRNQYPMRYWPHDPNAPYPRPYGIGQ